MKFAIKNTKSVKLNQEAADCIVLPVFKKKKLTGAAEQIDKASGGQISALIKRGDITGEAGECLMLPQVDGIKASRVLLVGLGSNEVEHKAYRQALKSACTNLKQNKIKSALFCLSEADVKDKDINWKLQQAVIAAGAANYRFDDFKSQKSPEVLKQIQFLAPDLKSTKQAVKQAEAIAKGMALTKYLGNLPGNVCNPSFLAKQAKDLAKTYTNFTTKVLSEAEMKKLGMNSLLAVSQGSDEPAKLIIMEYKGAKNKSEKPHVLVGKGITFDSGGISIKPSAAMDEMKYDMCGAGTVFGSMKAIAEMKLPLNVVGIVASAENMPGGKATRPGDIVKSMSGQSIEILNTDAEGRLVLCDALTYSERYKPKSIIDIATLTGAMVVALGHHYTGVFSNNDKLRDDILAAGKAASDEAWPMPMGEEYNQELNSNFADMANIGSRWGGSITAACFLGRFTEKQKWAHLDIAGTAWREGTEKGASGRPVPMIVHYLINQV